MTNKNYLFFILPIAAILLLPLFISSCKQPDTYVTPVGPPPCDTCLTPFMTPGFACRINGKPFIANWGGGGFIRTRFDYYEQMLHVKGSNSDIEEVVSINLGLITDTGLYHFPNTLLTESSSFYRDHSGLIFSYSAEPIKKGYIHITRLDSIKGSVAGKFEFELYSKDFEDTVHITDGRFFMNK